ncbi:hypothetical protein [Aquisphaera insulae]|uniref:hypothetical protein n=1 Tax=Aquisphaera insulae TaxID=2712864 RepID=UPI0013ECD1D1|nr:hypothetical protein [Aquisphaera insulae]
MPDPPRPWSPDPRLSNVPTDVLRNRRESPVQITSPVLEFSAIQLAALVNPIGRPFGLKEMAIIDDIYQGSVDAARVRVVETSILNAPTTLGNQIRVPPGWSFLDNKPVLVHEMGHIWQYQTRGTSYITDSVYHNASGQIATGNRNVAYMNYRLRNDSNFTDFTAEEQATIIGDYYEITRIYKDTDPPPAWVALRRPDLPIYERLIAQVRSATPRSDTTIYQESLMNQPQPGFDFSGPSDIRPMQVMPLIQFRFKGL